jgi:hypothetical protein
VLELKAEVIELSIVVSSVVVIVPAVTKLSNLVLKKSLCSPFCGVNKLSMDVSCADVIVPALTKLSKAVFIASCGFTLSVEVLELKAEVIELSIVVSSAVVIVPAVTKLSSLVLKKSVLLSFCGVKRFIAAVS